MMKQGGGPVLDSQQLMDDNQSTWNRKIRVAVTICMALLLMRCHTNTLLHTMIERKRRFEEEDEEDEDATLMLAILSKKRRKLAASNNFMAVIERFDHKQFKRHFRMSREVFEMVCSELHAVATKYDVPGLHQNQPGRPAVSIEKQLMVTLWYLATCTETLANIGLRFGLCEATTYRIRKRINSVICKYLMKKFISMPSNFTDTINTFKQGRGLNNVVGAIDGSHIPINPPKGYPETYYCRKGFHSMQLQIVVDGKMRIMDAYTGWPGSVHDSKVFDASPISKVLNRLPDQHVLLGDSAYPCLEHLMVPFKGKKLPDPQQKYNFIHSSTRMAVECAIGLLKGRFRRLKRYMDIRCLEDIVECILSACVMHNIALNSGTENVIDMVRDGMDDIETEMDDNEDENESGSKRRYEMLLECQNL